jgi:hypothetical protein
MARDQAARGFTMRVLRDADTLWRLEGREQQAAHRIHDRANQ